MSNNQGKYDAIIVGAGHNGLVAANYLGRASKKVLVLERRDIVGGACVTEEFFPGVKSSSCSFIQSVLRPDIIEDLELVSRFGLEMYAPDPQGFALFEDGSHVMLWQDIDKTLKQLEMRNPEDAKGYLQFGTRLRRFGELTSHWLLTEPPSRAEVISLFEQAGEEELLNEFMFNSTRDLLNNYFTSPEIRGFFTFFGIVSIWGGPSTPGTGYLFGYHASGEFENTFGRWAFPRGGMGSITQSLKRGAEAFGVEVMTGASVAEIVISKGRATGVRLEDGRVFDAPVIMSNAHPKPTLLELVDQKHLKADFRRRVDKIDVRGSMARIHLLIDELPQYLGFPDASSGPQHRGHAILGGSEERFEEAYSAMLKGEFPEHFAIEAILQSVTDDTICPPGKHMMTLGVQNLPFDLAEGNWDTRREEFADRVIDDLCRFAPNLRQHILGRHVITPLDLERTYGLTGGNIFHVAMTVQHLYGARPLPELCDYRTPIQGFYLCGAGTHPGGGVTGAPGHNAAAAVLADHGGMAVVRDRTSGKPKGRGLVDKVMDTELGREIGYQFARNRLFRSMTRLGTKTGGPKK